jgi:hypothetical protein
MMVQVILKGGHLGEGEGNRRKLRRIWLIYFLYNNEYRILNQLNSPLERDEGKKGK